MKTKEEILDEIYGKYNSAVFIRNAENTCFLSWGLYCFGQSPSYRQTTKDISPQKLMSIFEEIDIPFIVCKKRLIQAPESLFLGFYMADIYIGKTLVKTVKTDNPENCLSDFYEYNKELFPSFHTDIDDICKENEEWESMKNRHIVFCEEYNKSINKIIRGIFGSEDFTVPKENHKVKVLCINDNKKYFRLTYNGETFTIRFVDPKYEEPISMFNVPARSSKAKVFLLDFVRKNDM